MFGIGLSGTSDDDSGTGAADDEEASNRPNARQPAATGASAKKVAFAGAFELASSGRNARFRTGALQYYLVQIIFKFLLVFGLVFYFNFCFFFDLYFFFDSQSI